MRLKHSSWGKRILLAAVALFLLFLAYDLFAVRGTFAPSRPASAAGGNPITVGSPGHRIAGRVYFTGTPGAAQPLIVVLHGDAPYLKPRYQYAVAAELAAALPGARVAALLRPGYADPYGAGSDGGRGFASGDNYTPEDVDRVAAAIHSLKAQWTAPSAILVGHSGGAAIAANVAARHPAIASHIFLIGCPCDVPAFRAHMARLNWGPMWLLPTHSLSPLQTLDEMKKQTEITAISGAEDPITLPQYARAYIAKAASLGISSSMVELPGKGHEILDDPAVLQAVAKSARTAN